MENIKKNPLSLQLNADDFLPASNEEKHVCILTVTSIVNAAQNIVTIYPPTSISK